MAPGGVRPDEDDQVGGVEIVIGRWDDILAERAHLARDRARHAESRIGVDVRGADVPLHQFVGDIIVFVQKLPRDVKGDAARTMARDGLLEPLRDEVERLVPTRSFVTDHGRKQAARSEEHTSELQSLMRISYAGFCLKKKKKKHTKYTTTLKHKRCDKDEYNYTH